MMRVAMMVLAVMMQPHVAQGMGDAERTPPQLPHTGPRQMAPVEEAVVRGWAEASRAVRLTMAEAAMDAHLKTLKPETVRTSHYGPGFENGHATAGGVPVWNNSAPVLAIPENSSRFPLGSIILLEYAGKQVIGVVADTGRFGKTDNGVNNGRNPSVAIDVYEPLYKRLRHVRPTRSANLGRPVFFPEPNHPVNAYVLYRAPVRRVYTSKMSRVADALSCIGGIEAEGKFWLYDAAFLEAFARPEQKETLLWHWEQAEEKPRPRDPALGLDTPLCQMITALRQAGRY